jgi:hypothetical protein
LKLTENKLIVCNREKICRSNSRPTKRCVVPFEPSLGVWVSIDKKDATSEVAMKDIGPITISSGDANNLPVDGWFQLSNMVHDMEIKFMMVCSGNQQTKLLTMKFQGIASKFYDPCFTRKLIPAPLIRCVQIEAFCKNWWQVSLSLFELFL